MKFDFIVGNPPYQGSQNNSGGRGKTGTSLWDKFIWKAFDILNNGGYLCFITPPRWRKHTSKLYKFMINKQIHVLSLYSVKDGLVMFGSQTRFDWYIIENVNRYKNTEIRDYNGNVYYINLSEVPFIPNAEFEKIYSLVAKDGEEKVNILHNHVYDKRRNYMNKEKTDKYKYPCVYSINVKGDVTYYYSNRNDRGHFGVPKTIVPSGDVRSIQFLVDKNGEYGLTQYAFGIVDELENLDNIAKALSSDKFRKLAQLFALSMSVVDRDIISTFRKDFWKEFI